MFKKLFSKLTVKRLLGIFILSMFVIVTFVATMVGSEFTFVETLLVFVASVIVAGLLELAIIWIANG